MLKSYQNTWPIMRLISSVARIRWGRIFSKVSKSMRAAGADTLMAATGLPAQFRMAAAMQRTPAASPPPPGASPRSREAYPRSRGTSSSVMMGGG